MTIKNSHRFFKNTDCKYFPCHKNSNGEQINCLFCYCPLYFLGEKCGGGFKYVGEGKQIKDCSDCIIPHEYDGYDYVIRKIKEAVQD